MGTAERGHLEVGVIGRMGLIAALGAILFASCTCVHARGAETSAVIHPQLWPVARPRLRPDPMLERKVAALLARMSVEQKVGQLVQADITALTPADLREYPLGSVLNGGNSKPGGNTLAPAAAWLDVADQ